MPEAGGAPPIVPGLTDVPAENPSLEPMLSALLGGGQSAGPGPAVADLRAGMAALRRAAQSDPSIAGRIRAALDLLEGRDPGDLPRRRPESTKIGQRFDAKTPI